MLKEERMRNWSFIWVLVTGNRHWNGGYDQYIKRIVSGLRFLKIKGLQIGWKRRRHVIWSRWLSIKPWRLRKAIGSKGVWYAQAVSHKYESTCYPVSINQLSIPTLYVETKNRWALSHILKYVQDWIQKHLDDLELRRGRSSCFIIPTGVLQIGLNTCLSVHRSHWKDRPLSSQ